MHACVFTGTHMLEFGQYTNILYITYEANVYFCSGLQVQDNCLIFQ